MILDPIIGGLKFSNVLMDGQAKMRTNPKSEALGNKRTSHKK